MTTTASKEAWVKPENIKWRWTHREIIKHFLQQSKESLTYREISARVRLTYNQVEKRGCELEQEGIITYVGSKIEGNNMNSVFKFNFEPTLFPKPKKLTLKQWMKTHHPEILYKYELLERHQL